MGRIAWATPTTMDLKTCFEQALLHHESLPLAQKDIDQARARYMQILGAVLPKVNVAAYEQFQEKVSIPGVNSDFIRSRSQQLSVGVTQPLFHGLIDLYGLKMNLADQRQKSQLKQEAIRGLYQDVATAYYQVALIERAIATNSRILGVLRGEQNELDEWFKLGKIRESDLVSQKTEIAMLEAGIEKLKGQRNAAYEMLSFLTGVSPQPQIALKSPLSEKIQNVEYYISQTATRSDVMAAKEQITMSKNTVKMKKGALLPQIDFSANYYPYREGLQKDVDWDATFSLDMPVFNFTNFGAVKEAKSQLEQNKIKLSEQQRLAASEIRKTYALLKSDISRLAAYNKAANLAEQNCNLKRVDLQLGLATQFDLLQSQKTWIEALRERDAAEVDAWLNQATLKAQAGMYP